MSGTKKSVTIFNPRLAGKLMMEGLKLQGMQPDKKFPERDVYFFANCDKVHEIIKNFKAN